MSNFIDDIIENANKQIKYKNTVTTGEITVDNGDGTYDVKIDNADSAIPNVETLSYDAMFSVGEIVTIGFENGCKESPKILGHSKKIKQEPKSVEVDYSGEEGGGLQTETETIYCTNVSGFIFVKDTTDYDTCHNSIDGSDCDSIDLLVTTYLTIGQSESAGEYTVARSYLFFNTSTIPSNAIITNAVLSFTVADNQFIDWNIVIQDGQPNYPNNPIIASDYDCSKYSNNGGQRAAVAGASPPVYSGITLNSNGRAWINKGGITKFCLRSSQDISSLIPVDSLHAIIIDNDTLLPKLTITYTI